MRTGLGLGLGFGNAITPLPKTITGLLFWARADLGVTVVSSTSVTNWLDQSGTHDTQKNLSSGAFGKPTLNTSDAAYNNKATLSFASAASQLLSSGVWTSPLAEPETMFLVGNTDGAATDQRSADGGAGNQKLVWNVSGTHRAGIYAGAPLSSGLGLSSSPLVIAGQFNGLSSKLWISTLTAGASGTDGGSTRTGLTLGGAFGGGAYLNGKIAEVLIYNGILSTTNFAKMMNYLGSRYGISIGA